MRVVYGWWELIQMAEVLVDGVWLACRRVRGGRWIACLRGGCATEVLTAETARDSW